MTILVFACAVAVAWSKGVGVAIPLIPITAWIILRSFGWFRPAMRPVLSGLATIVLFSAAFSLLVDALAVGATLHDSTLVAADAALGLDAQAFAGWVNERCPGVSFWIYFSMIPQIILVLLLGDKEPFLRRFVFTGIFTACAFQVCHATGLEPGPQAAPVVARTLALSQGLVVRLDCTEAQGIILIIAAFWSTRFRYPALALNLAMILSAVPTGGHYFIDLFLGALLALSALSTIR